MSLTVFSDVPRSILALLLDRVGEARGMSPRLIMGKPDSLGPQQIAELYAGGFIELPDKLTISLTPQFIKVARVLLNPQTNLNIRIWGRDSICGETNIQFPRDIMDGGGVILNQLGRMYRISAFIDDTTVVKMMGDAIPEPIEQDLQFEFKAHLDNTVAAILFAVIDLARIKAGDKKNTELVLSMVFPAQEIYSYMYDRWSLTGFKDLITYVTAVGMMPEAPSLTDTVDGLRVLVKAGLLKEIRKDNYQLVKAIEPLVRLTVGQPSGIQWQSVSLMDNGEQIISNRTFLFADRSLMLCFAPTVKGRLFISRVRRKEITDFLASEITTTVAAVHQGANASSAAKRPAPVAAASGPRPKTTTPVVQRPTAPPPGPPAAAPIPVASPVNLTASPEVICTQCGAKLSPDAKHCSQCGAPVVAQKTTSAPAPAAASSQILITCPQCGAILKPDAKHCNQCGAPVIKQSIPTSPVCSNCGQIQKPGAKFCAKCGAPMGGQAIPSANICPQCGRQLNPGAKFCPGCGKKI
jgi:predicted amidophosphoribosyltransferase